MSPHSWSQMTGGSIPQWGTTDLSFSLVAAPTVTEELGKIPTQLILTQEVADGML